MEEATGATTLGTRIARRFTVRRFTVRRFTVRLFTVRRSIVPPTLGFAAITERPSIMATITTVLIFHSDLASKIFED